MAILGSLNYSKPVVLKFKNLRKILSEMFRKYFIQAWGWVGILIIPLFVIFILPLLLILLLSLRLAVYTLARIFRRDLSEMVRGSTGIFAVEKSRVNASLNIAVIVVIDGDVNLQTARMHVQQRILDSKDQNSGKLVYDRLGQYWVPFLNYAFWKRDKNFRIENHVRGYDYSGNLALPKPCSQQDLEKVLGNLQDAPWKEEQSPWEWLRVPYYSQSDKSKPQTVGILRYNHVLADAYSIREILSSLIQSPISVPMPNFEKKKLNLSFFARLLWKLPYDVGVNFMDSLLSEKISLDRNLPHDCVCSSSEPIPVEVIKRLKNEYDVNYVTVLFSAAFGALQRALEDEGKRVPPHLISTLPLPKPKHPGGMVNHAYLLLARWPVKSTSPSERLVRLHGHINELKNSTAPLAYSFVSELFGLAPIFARRVLFKFLFLRMCSFVITSFPVTPDRIHYDGHEILSMLPITGTWNQVGTSITMAGVGNEQVAIFNTDTRFISRRFAAKLGMYFRTELEALGNPEQFLEKSV